MNIDPGLWLEPQGKLRWFYMQSYGFWDGRAGVWASTTDEPDKAVPRWSPPRRLADGIMMNKPTVLRDGTWLFCISIWAQEPAKRLPVSERKHVPDEQNKWNEAAVGAHVYRSTVDEGTAGAEGADRAFASSRLPFRGRRTNVVRRPDAG